VAALALHGDRADGVTGVRGTDPAVTVPVQLTFGLEAPPGYADLLPREREFVAHYLETGLNGAEAARRAGYSKNGARQRASELLARRDIRRVLDEATARAGVKIERVIGRNESASLMWAAIAMDPARPIKDRKLAQDAARGCDMILLTATGKGPTQYNENQTNVLALVANAETMDMVSRAHSRWMEQWAKRTLPANAPVPAGGES
jgi:hypothetical protein